MMHTNQTQNMLRLQSTSGNMSNLLGQIYGWFQSLFGQELSYYLWGYDPATQGYTNPNIYNLVGIFAISISLIIVLAYYYIINHPSLCKWWSWLIVGIVNGLIGLFSGYGIVAEKYVKGFIPPQLMYQYDKDGNIVSNLIGYHNCWGFGIANAFFCLILFLLFTFCFKWWSSNAKHVPIL